MFVAATMAGAALFTGAQADEAVPAPEAGRFLYAGDDDWDWASPLGAEEPCKLVRYGEMNWSALDWAEEGLPEVRGVLVGIPPDARKTMSMEDLSKLRGEKATYRHEPQQAGVIKRLLAGENPPNLIILMQNVGRDGSLGGEDTANLIDFVKTGGRVLVLDEWKSHHGVLDAAMEEALKLPPGPPIAEPPLPDPPAESAPSEPEPTPEPEPSEQFLAMKERFAELLPKLSDDQFRVRENASAAIRELGPGVLELIEGVQSDDPEVRFRLRKIREALQPKPIKKPTLSQEQRDAQRKAKYEFNVNLVRNAARKLREARIPHQMSDVLVDKEKRPLPTLRIEFPVDQP